MKYIITSIITIAVLSGVVYAQTAIRLPDNQVTEIYSKTLDTHNITLIRVQDGDNTCYIPYSRRVFVSYGIDCVQNENN